jgi:hypothetical protein
VIVAGTGPGDRRSLEHNIGGMEAAMDPASSTRERALLAELRRRRAELLQSMGALEHALAAPAPGLQASWAEHVRVALVELSADFGAHVAVTERPDGLYREVLETAPRLSGAVARLTREHALISDLVDNLMACVSEPGITMDVDTVRDRGTGLIGRLVRHRQRGSDLIYEAYTADIGGET